MGDGPEGREAAVHIAHLQFIGRREERRLELPGGPEGDDPPEVQEGVAVDDCLALEEIVGREQDRAAAGHPVPEDRAKPDPHAHVDVRERLVEEQHAGVAEHHPREFRALPLAHRKLADPALPVVRDAEERQGPFHLHRDVVGRDAGHLREEREVPSDGHLLVRERNVDEDPQLPPHLVGGGPDIDAADRGRAGVGLGEPREDPQASRLARAVRPEQAEHLALLDFQRDLVEGADSRILFDEPRGLYKHPLRSTDEAGIILGFRSYSSNVERPRPCAAGRSIPRTMGVVGPVGGRARRAGPAGLPRTGTLATPPAPPADVPSRRTRPGAGPLRARA